VVFKPHPIDTDPYVLANIQGIRVVRDVNVHALIDLADVVVAQFTTLQFEAALYDKPVVLLGRSAWWGRNAAYEVNTRGELIPALQAALARKNWTTRAANARAFLTWTMEHFHIGCTETVPARRTLRDFAKFIAETSLDARHLPPLEDRWEAAEAMMEQLRGIPKPSVRPTAEFALA
jgi:CDP-glycerol glycerophosphotransferase (TagB/SpsB family)